MLDHMKNKSHKDFMNRLMMKKSNAVKDKKKKESNSKNRVVRVSKNIFILYRG